MPGYERAGRVKHVGQIDGSKEIFDKWTPELALHERIGYEQARESCSSAGRTGQLEESHNERDRQRVFTAAHRINRR